MKRKKSLLSTLLLLLLPASLNACMGSRTAPVSSCTLLTAADAQAALGGPVEAPFEGDGGNTDSKSAASLCDYKLKLKTDKTKAWQTFAQHRVQYECALMTLIRLKKPPRGARWTTDREEATKPLSIPVFGSRQATRQPPTTGANITGSRSR